MANQRYEHHLLLNEKLCPFIIGNEVTGDKVVANWHRNIEILVILDGEGYCQYGAEEKTIKANDIIIVNSGTLHRPHSQGSLIYEYLIIDEDFCLRNGISTENVLFENQFCDEKTKALFLNAIKRIKEYKNNKENSYSAPQAINAVLSLLIDICLNHVKNKEETDKTQSISEKYVKKVIEYISDNFCEQISLDELAKMCNITKFHLIREFKRYTGQTVFTYINILKCKKAQVCLMNGLTVTETATECGFDSVSYFSQVYKKIMGYPPTKNKKTKAP